MNYLEHLSQDKVLKQLIEQQPAFSLQKRNKVYLRLCSSILGQQLSTHVARVLYERFLELYGNREPSAKRILNTPNEILCSIGFSRAKASYVHNVCSFFLEQHIKDRDLDQLDDDEVIQLLTQIKGVGRWTTEMILMFTLGREDVFARDDLGLQQSMIQLYDLRYRDKKILLKKMEKIAAKWSPYRTYACRYLWDWKDGK